MPKATLPSNTEGEIIEVHACNYQSPLLQLKKDYKNEIRKNTLAYGLETRGKCKYIA